jgi:hypothetical protein
VGELKILAERMKNIEYNSRRRNAAIIHYPVIMISYLTAKMIVHCTGSKE